jgi:hypothetical protein
MAFLIFSSGLSAPSTLLACINPARTIRDISDLTGLESFANIQQNTAPRETKCAAARPFQKMALSRTMKTRSFGEYQRRPDGIS